MANRYAPIEDSGIIGDLHTVALVGKNVSIDRMGDLSKARFFFEKMLGYANYLGLYGEELGPRAQPLGNFPQAFTHLALISAAYDLDRRLSAAGPAG